MTDRSGRSSLLLSSAEIAVGLVFGAGAVTKLIDPRPSFEVAESVTSCPWLAAVAVAVAVTMETSLAVAVAVGALRGRRALLMAVAGLAVVSAWLVVVWAVLGSRAPCACLPGLRRSTVVHALTANAIVAAEILAVFVIDRRCAPGKARLRGT